ncbi:MAG: cytoplasmic protein [Blastocatellia bacterium]|nr:MAG: cytoplasmic protein [Blastocatellia bacterium]
MTVMLDALRGFAVSRNFFKSATLKQALTKMQFVQADPIRAPARAQDLILRQRVANYRVGDLENQYSSLDIEEDFFVNYGYVTRHLQSLMHPRSESRVPADDIGRSWPAAQRKKVKLLLEFVRQRGVVHPREVDESFSHGKVRNYWGGSSNATTHLLDAMHYQGLLRVVRREKGIRLYSPQQHASVPMDAAERRARMDALADIVVGIYAPLTGPSLSFYVRRLRFAAPQWQGEVKSTFERARERLSKTRIDGVDWYWLSNESMTDEHPEDRVLLLAPFDPLVHDRTRFELLWGWTYRFEAYTPVHKRERGYYAMPMLWRDSVIGWANLALTNGKLNADFGYIKGKPREKLFRTELDVELDRIREFLGLAK